MEKAALQFMTASAPQSTELYGDGHINRTYLVICEKGERYILQRISTAAFHDIPGLMENISGICAALDKEGSDPRSCLHLVPVSDGSLWLTDEQGEYWRMYEFISDSMCLQEAETPSDFYESAVAFGRFQRMLRDYPSSTLHETIPDFHNTIDRYRIFREAIAEDTCGRAACVQKEIAFFLDREEAGGRLQRMREKGELPVRVTHNDTKLNNVLLDQSTRKALCVIDLDTVMPGLVAYDFGDAIRFGASTGAEDEKDLSKIRLDLGLFETFASGFIPECGGLTDLEISTLPLGAMIMTLENGVRFLTDYLKGDVYYSIARPEHNLDRARTQIRLVEDMERKWEDMNAVIRKFIS